MEKELTFEHVPPKSAFNKWPVKRYSQFEVIKQLSEYNWNDGIDFSKIRWQSIQQAGSGGYYLCQDCNSKMGDWYIQEYVRLTRIFDMIVREKKPNANERISVTIKDLHPLRLIKAIMVLFSDISPRECIDQKLRDYLLNKEATDFDMSKYQFYMFLAAPNLHRETPIGAVMTSSGESIIFSEIARYPLGLLLYHNIPSSFLPNELPINALANSNYYDSCNVCFDGIPYLSTESPLSYDYRSFPLE